jgi:radical SAM protein with 4Fe4S-binding SPASM domain
MPRYCVIPWIHTCIESTGEVYPCCAYDSSNGAMGSLKESSIEEIWTSDNYKKLRSQMLNGEIPAGCEGCHNTEKQGGQSKRQRENKLREHLLHLVQNDEPPFELKYVDFRFSNVCNFKCRYCNPMASHSIAAEYKQLKWENHYDSDILRFKKENGIDSFYNRINDLEEIYFCGGEPLLMDEHYEFLEKLIEAGNTDLVLRYSSNLSRLTYKGKHILDYWKHFSNVSVHASIDHYGDKLEYIRKGANWKEILNNLKEISGYDNIELRIGGTVSVFNVLDLPDIVETFNSLDMFNYDRIAVANVVRYPEYYNIQSLHPDIKKLVNQKLQSYTPNYSMIELMCKYIIRFMNEKDTWEENRQKFSDITKTLDLHRKENFTSTFPELRKQIEW